MTSVNRAVTVMTQRVLTASVALLLTMTMVACFEATGGDVSPLPGNDASVPTCDQCPEGEQCHPEARICVPCPNGECAQAADAAQAIPVVDAGPMGGGMAGGTPMTGGAAMAGAMTTSDMGLPIPDMMASGGGSTVDAAQCMPGDEVCDGQDNDCDGNTDEDTNLLDDVANCGACDVKCEAVPNGSATCVDGQCGYRCNDGFEDSDGLEP